MTQIVVLNLINNSWSKVMTKFHIYWQNQHGIWQKYLTKTNEADTFRTMTRRAKSTNLRHKMTDDSGHMLDVVNP